MPPDSLVTALREDVREIRDNMRMDAQKVQETIGDLRDRLTKHEAEDSTRHTIILQALKGVDDEIKAIMEGQAAIKEAQKENTGNIKALVTGQDENVKSIKALTETQAQHVASIDALRAAVEAKGMIWTSVASPRVLTGISTVVGGAALLVLQWLGAAIMDRLDQQPKDDSTPPVILSAPPEP